MNHAKSGQAISAKAFRAVAQEDIQKDYLPLSEAARALGMSTKRLLALCERNGITHFKYRGRWMVHKAKLFGWLKKDWRNK